MDRDAFLSAGSELRQAQERSAALRRELGRARRAVEGQPARGEATDADRRAARERLSKARAEHEAARAEEARLRSGAAFADPARALAFKSPNAPIVLFPLRLETRFRDGELLVRVYPDDCLVDTFEEQLSATELQEAQDFWLAWARAAGDTQKQRDAWCDLVSGFNPGRAGYLIETRRPANAAGLSFDDGAVVVAIPLLTPISAASRTALARYWLAVAAREADNAISALRADLVAALAQDAGIAGDADAFIATTTPPGLDETGGPSANLRPVIVEFPPGGDNTIIESWTRPARVSLLPERLVLIGRRDNRTILTKIGEPVANPLQVGPDPLDETVPNPANDSEVDLGDQLKWLVDFDEAVAKGMGFRVDVTDLTAPDLGLAFDQLFALGVDLSSGAQDGARKLSDLIGRHEKGSAGFGILPVGTPTNNDEANDAGAWRTSADDTFELIAVPIATGAPAAAAEEGDPMTRDDGRFLADALGVDRAVFDRVPHASGTDMADARALTTAIWPATLGYWQQTMMAPVFSAAANDWTRWFCCHFVTGRGSAPTILIGDQPYGILPATSFDDMTWPRRMGDAPRFALQPPDGTWTDPAANGGSSLRTGFPVFFDRLFLTLMRASRDWRTMSEHVQTVFDTDDDHLETFLDILGLHAGSVEFHRRLAISRTHLINLFLYMGQPTDLLETYEAELNAGATGVRTAAMTAGPDAGPANPNAGRSIRTLRATLGAGPGLAGGAGGPPNTATFDPVETLEQILAGVHPTAFDPMSPVWRARIDEIKALEHDRRTWDQMRDVLEDNVFWYLKSFGYRVSASNDRPALADLIFNDSAPTLITELVQPGPTSELIGLRPSTADGRNYLRWLADAATASFDDLRRQEGFSDGRPTALLYRMLHNALQQGFYKVVVDIFDDLGELDAAEVLQARSEASFIHIANIGDTSGNPPGNATLADTVAYDRQSESRYDILYRDAPATLGPVAGATITDHILSNLTTWERTRELADQIRALERLVNTSTASLQRLLSEHIDLCTYRLDAWKWGLLNYQLETIRRPSRGSASSATSGSYVGVYGWLEDVRPGPRAARAEVRLDDGLAEALFPAGLHPQGPPPIVEDDSNDGFVHAPSPDHATTAAILRSAFRNNADRQTPGLYEVNLSSHRVRSAMWLIDGIRQGDSLGRLLGYRLERRLHDSGLELDAVIFALRRAIPLRGAETELDATSERPAAPLVDGLALLEHIEASGNGQYPFGKALPALSAEQVAAVNAAVDDLTDASDAVADLALSESVYQAVQRRGERSDAMLRALSEGLSPPMPDIATSPRSGIDLTHRVALHLTPGLPHDARNTPRSQTEPALDDWLSRNLPNRITCAIRLERADGPGETLVLDQNDLGLSAYDLLFMLNPEFEAGASGLSSRIFQTVRTLRAGGRPLTFATLSVDYGHAEVGSVSFLEAAALVAALRSLVLSSSPLAADDLVAPGAASGDAASVEVRLAGLQAAMQAADLLRRDPTNASDDLGTLIAELADVTGLQAIAGDMAMAVARWTDARSAEGSVLPDTQLVARLNDIVSTAATGADNGDTRVVLDEVRRVSLLLGDLSGDAGITALTTVDWPNTGDAGRDLRAGLVRLDTALGAAGVMALEAVSRHLVLASATAVRLAGSSVLAVATGPVPAIGLAARGAVAASRDMLSDMMNSPELADARGIRERLGALSKSQVAAFVDWLTRLDAIAHAAALYGLEAASTEGLHVRYTAIYRELMKLRAGIDGIVGPPPEQAHGVLLEIAAMGGSLTPVTKRAVEVQKASLLALTGDLLAVATALDADLAQRLDNARASLGEAAAAGGSRERVERQVDAARALFGGDFLLMPEFRLAPEPASAFAAAFARRASLLQHLIDPAAADHDAFPMGTWLHGVARVRPQMRHLEAATAYAEIAGSAEIAGDLLAPIQLPVGGAPQWLGLRHDVPPTADHLLYTAIFPPNFDSAGPRCGLLLDAWTETLPAAKETTGLVFNYDAPNAEPPQTILVALSPQPDREGWDWEHLVGALVDTVAEAKSRAVELRQFEQWQEPPNNDPTQWSKATFARFLPATIAAVTGTISISLDYQDFGPRVFEDPS